MTMRRESVALLGAAAVTVIVFAVTPLDLASARLFYRPDGVDRWPMAKEPLWATLYGAAPWITASLVLIGLFALALGVARRRERWRRHGVFVLFAVALGPGLVVNTLFKDHWHRPRPRDVVELGGALHYVQPLAITGEGGGSFPCGHCSVGFLYALGWWMWRRDHPARARASLAIGIAAGGALGLGRMAAGGHFLSDVVWSALLALGVAHLLYHHVLRVDAVAFESASPPRRRIRLEQATAMISALAGVGVLTTLFATAHGAAIDARIALDSLSPRPQAFELDARTANVEVVLVDAPAGEISIDGELHGFGVPTSRLETRSEVVAGAVPTLRYRIVERGWFTDLDGSAIVRLPAGEVRRVAVRLGRGNILVRDETRERVASTASFTLDLVTGSGQVQRPSSPVARAAARS